MIGYASTLYKKVKDVPLYAELIKIGLSDEDKVAELREFSPFGNIVKRSEEEPLRHKGVGTEILSQLLGECKSDGVAGIYCLTGVEHMQDLLDKLEFQKITNFYFKSFSSRHSLSST